MHIFFVKSLMRCTLDILFQRKINKFLTSFYDSKGSNQFITEYAPQEMGKDKFLIIDSGAFSAWSLGDQINIDDYVEYCHNIKKMYADKIKHIFFVNLDVIPGRKYVTPTIKQREQSCAQGYANMKYMQSKGLKVIHVFHQHEDFEFLKQLITEIDYIGISPANDSVQKEKIKFMDKCFSIVQDKVKCHGFAVTAPESMMRYPWYSVDSMSYNAIFMWGKSIFTNAIDGLSSRERKHQLYAFEKDLDFLEKYEKTATELWKSRGVVWND